VVGEAGDGGEEVGVEEADAGGDAVELGVVAGDGEGVGGDVQGGDVGEGEMAGDGDGDGPGAGADVEDAEGLGVGEAGEDGLDQQLGLGAGYEDGGCYAEGKTVELLDASDVLDGLVGETAGDGSLIGGLLFGGERGLGIGEEAGARDLKDVEEEELGVAVCGVFEVGISGESGGGSGESFVAGGRCFQWTPPRTKSLKVFKTCCLSPDFSFGPVKCQSPAEEPDVVVRSD
jgi:hypothetical protein